MERITKVSDLPEWIRKKTYSNKLSDIDWYREIRRRQKLFSLIDFHKKELTRIDEDSREFLLDMLERDIRPDSMIFHIPQDGVPICDLTVGETTFLAFSTQQSGSLAIINKYKKLLELWSDTLDKRKSAGEDRPPTYGQYDLELAHFVDQLSERDSEILEAPIAQYSDPLRNPFLSYGRPLNGYPLTIDLQFDDKTILDNVKKWLAEKREAEQVKARRPFTQQDFDDWQFYKTREIFDLEAWAAINDAKIFDRVIADALWPNAPDGFSAIDVLRTTARKKVREIFTFETVVRLYGQLRLEHGENFLAK